MSGPGDEPRGCGSQFWAAVSAAAGGVVAVVMASLFLGLIGMAAAMKRVESEVASAAASVHRIEAKLNADHDTLRPPAKKVRAKAAEAKHEP